MAEEGSNGVKRDKTHVLFEMIGIMLLVAAGLAFSGCTQPAAVQAPAGNETGTLSVDTTPTAALAELTPEVFLLSEGSPDIIVSAPLDDRVKNGTVNLKGRFIDMGVSSATITINGVPAGQIPVANGTFGKTVKITGPTGITITATNSSGATLTARIILDGDSLPAPYERLCGFDPLNPDSDSIRTAANESGNGMFDGFEILDGTLACYFKYTGSANPLSPDTDGDGLNDSFELMRLSQSCSPAKVDTDGNGVADPYEDPDGDRLTNLQEQLIGTNPLSTDIFWNGVSEGRVGLYSVELRTDHDRDGLPTGSELLFGTGPDNPDTDGDSIPDGNESYKFSYAWARPCVNVTLTGKGDIIGDEFRVANVTSEYYAAHPAGVGPLAAIYPNDHVEAMEVAMPYPDNVVSPASLAICYYNDSFGFIMPVDSIVDEAGRTVRGRIDMRETRPILYSGLMVRVFDIGKLYDVYMQVYAVNSKFSFPENQTTRIEIKNTVNISVISRGADGRPVVTNRTLQFMW